MTKEQREKSRFRSTSTWKKFRKHMGEKAKKKDAITGKALIKGWQLHHLDLNCLHYKNLDNEDNFTCLNRKTHEIVHWLYRYYSRDPEIIDRLRNILDRMVEINTT